MSTATARRPRLDVVELGHATLVLNDQRGTVATVTANGYIDWVRRSPGEEGPVVSALPTPTGLSGARGVVMRLTCPDTTDLRSLTWEAHEEGPRLVTLHATAVSADGSFASTTSATLVHRSELEDYAWEFETEVTVTGGHPLEIPGFEYNNVYPARCGLGILYAAEKDYGCTVLVDAAGDAWQFPHQHALHYGQKIDQLRFAVGSRAGFFGAPPGAGAQRAPAIVVTVLEANAEPDWDICNRFYDLHCLTRLHAPLQPGQEIRVRYAVAHVDAQEADRVLTSSRPVTVTDADRAVHNFPRLDVGLNRFDRPVIVDRFDEHAWFRPHPPQRRWETDEAGGQASLRIENNDDEETAWQAEPELDMPPDSALRVSARVKTEGVVGRGAFVRVRCFTTRWEPTVHVEWTDELESPLVTGTSDGWVDVAVPELSLAVDQIGYCFVVSFVLAGTGRAWFTDLEIVPRGG